MIRINGRSTIGKPDKLFGVSALAKARIAEIGKENVINSTLGVLLDDNGKLVVLSSVMEALHELRPEEFAAYAPIIGIPEYKEAVTKAVFLDEVPQKTQALPRVLIQKAQRGIKGRAAPAFDGVIANLIHRIKDGEHLLGRHSGSNQRLLCVSQHSFCNPKFSGCRLIHIFHKVLLIPAIGFCKM